MEIGVMVRNDGIVQVATGTEGFIVNEGKKETYNIDGLYGVDLTISNKAESDITFDYKADNKRLAEKIKRLSQDNNVLLMQKEKLITGFTEQCNIRDKNIEELLKENQILKAQIDIIKEIFGN